LESGGAPMLRIEGLPVMTADLQFKAYDLDIIWGGG